MYFTEETSKTTPEFWKHYYSLSPEIQQLADNKYELFLLNPALVKFKRLSSIRRAAVYAVQVGRKHRALGEVRNGVIYWFFIGDHAEYDQFIASLH